MADPPDLSELTLRQKVALGSGADMWRTRAVGAVGAVTLVDGPHGVRMPTARSVNNLDVSTTQPATCFPPAVALAQTWDPALIERVGVALGIECRALGVDVLLGPGLNIKRDPRAGRNFEYFSEDPLLTAALGAAWVAGLQSTGVGASVKHFAANNAETDRMRASSDVDARTLREIYLRAFQAVVQRVRPWTVMCSYNRINGVYASQNRWLLTDVLREEWGFDGVVVSDWGAVSDRVAAVAAGLDLEMPGAGDAGDTAVVAAVEAGVLSTSDVDRAAGRVARLSARMAQRGPAAQFDSAAHHALAREVAGRAVVLLKNDGELLPLDDENIAVIGEFAEMPVYQGGGSSHVRPTRIDVPIEEIRRLAGDRTVSYAPGFAVGGDGSAALREEAVRQAAAADVAVVFLGLPPGAESEGWDREHIDLPVEQLDLLRAVVEAQPRTVAVLSHGGVVRSGQVAELAGAVLDGALLGQGGGGAIADVLLGQVNPSGRLAETVPLRLEDAPSYLNFPGEAGQVHYGERIFVGYRGYDAMGRDVAYPFGHGLSYTEFEYADLSVKVSGHAVTVRLTVTNSGRRSGREVVQVYAGMAGSVMSRPRRWLVSFGDVTLDAGETAACELRFAASELAYWHTGAGRWVIESGEYTIWVGASSRDLRLTETVTVSGDEPRAALTLESTFAEVLSDPHAGPAVISALSKMGGDVESTLDSGADLVKIMGDIPIGRIITFTGGRVSADQIRALLEGGQA